ncbi:hypothetical protein FA10DRAFT_304431 [Acaromyces ingoldii]|uniref:Uncharacterized protein n=1 Tax=Acaromyces ingoldii TaxID=215250 RepID=A0A316YFW6_9BASI|nr:hypothetical protein FA10DRAFT_304431 [Acaromyces ingoldii]PWN87003.1 hypothetical protein FA10DRAFT_304431 [Acaromyces ingoldii]
MRLSSALAAHVHKRAYSTAMAGSSSSSGSKTVAPYGTWKSPISADLLAQKRLTFGEIAVVAQQRSHADIAYVENRPWEKGRAALIHQRIALAAPSDGAAVTVEGEGRDVTLGKYNARSGVHEYGGGALAPAQPGSGKVLFSDITSSSVYEAASAASTSTSEESPREVTPTSAVMRYGDFSAHPSQPCFLAAREDHTVDEPARVVNTLVCVDEARRTVHELASGCDFYAAPRFSHDGTLVAWVSWNHPSMPFWATQLWVARFEHDGGTPKLVGTRQVGGQAGGEVLHHPVWAADTNTLYFASDRTGFAQPYAVDVGPDAQLLGPVRPLLAKPVEADFIHPAWTLNNSSFSFLSPDWLACIVTTRAIDGLALVHLPSGQLHALDTPFVTARQLRATSPSSFVFVGSTYAEPDALVAVDVAAVLADPAQKPTWTVIKRSSTIVHDGTVDAAYLSRADTIEFPTELPNGMPATAHAVVYAPKNKDYIAPTGSAPPAIIMSHGGPTAHYGAGLALELQYWTTRGFLVCLVNYGGSTGYGRAYMERLMGTWGQVDVRDCVAAAQYLGSSDHEGIVATAGARAGADRRTLAATKAQRRVSQRGQAELANLEERQLASGAVEITLANTDGGNLFSIGLVDGLLAAVLGAAGHLIPGATVQQGLMAAGAAWLLRKLFHVQEETVKVIPTVGIELTTTRGVRLPSFLTPKSAGANEKGSSSSSSSRRRPFFVASVAGRMIPRDCIMDLVTNEAFSRWRIVDYCAVATRPPPSAKSFSRGSKLEVLFPNLLPRLPVVEHVYRAIYPALFGHDQPAATSSSSSGGINNEKSGHVSLDVAAAPGSSPRADGAKIAIAGGSAGGYSVLCGLCMYPHAFQAGVSRYGVGDLVGLEALSHKFESRYLHQLLGGSPTEIPQVYHDRSPIHAADRIRAPVLFLQGDIDKVVPPSQSEQMYDEIRKRGGKTKYVLYKGEGHGFRDAKHITDALAQEEAWYRDVFKLDE